MTSFEVNFVQECQSCLFFTDMETFGNQAGGWRPAVQNGYGEEHVEGGGWYWIAVEWHLSIYLINDPWYQGSASPWWYGLRDDSSPALTLLFSCKIVVWFWNLKQWFSLKTWLQILTTFANEETYLMKPYVRKWPNLNLVDVSSCRFHVQITFVVWISIHERRGRRYQICLMIS